MYYLSSLVRNLLAYLTSVVCNDNGRRHNISCFTVTFGKHNGPIHEECLILLTAINL